MTARRVRPGARWALLPSDLNIYVPEGKWDSNANRLIRTARDSNRSRLLVVTDESPRQQGEHDGRSAWTEAETDEELIEALQNNVAVWYRPVGSEAREPKRWVRNGPVADDPVIPFGKHRHLLAAERLLSFGTNVVDSTIFADCSPPDVDDETVGWRFEERIDRFAATLCEGGRGWWASENERGMWVRMAEPSREAVTLLRFHEYVAERLHEKPQHTLEYATRRLDQQRTVGTSSPLYRQWRLLVNMGPTVCAGVCRSLSPASMELRKVTPFRGLRDN